MIILDFGSGETCKNDFHTVKRMIKSVPNTLTDVIIKWQLFENIPPLIPLKHDVYLYARDLAERRGFGTAASVFDKPSLDFLLTTDPAFVKIACRPHLYHLLEKVPDDVLRVVSVGSDRDFTSMDDTYPEALIMCCVAKYPAAFNDYGIFSDEYLRAGISDHTESWRLYKKFEPEVYECHYALEDSTGPDAASFARRPKALEAIL